MPSAANERAAEAKKLYRKGMKMVDIGKKLGVSASTVRSWKNRYDWDNKNPQKGKCNVAKDDAKNDAKKDAKKDAKVAKSGAAASATPEASATLQKKKRGAPYGNQNAKGGRGNPHPVPHPPPDTTKHGGYANICLDTLNDEEKALLDSIPEDPELSLIHDLQVLTIRERRFMKAIQERMEQKGELVVSEVTKTEEKRAFDSAEDEEIYNERIKDKVDAGERLPGRRYNIQTVTEHKDASIVRMEQQLTTIQRSKIKAAEALAKMQLERQKADGLDAGDTWADDWMASAIEAEEHGGGEDV